MCASVSKLGSADPQRIELSVVESIANRRLSTMGWVRLIMVGHCYSICAAARSRFAPNASRETLAKDPTL